MTHLEITFNTDDPEIASILREANALHPENPERLLVEAGLCQWWANRCLMKIGAIEGRNRMEKARQDRARDTRERNRIAREAKTE